MGFRALQDNNEEILSLDFDQLEWEKLKKKDSFKQTLKMICCDSKAVMKTSKLGLQFFSHLPKKGCDFKPETIDHLMLKKYVYMTLKEMGYKTEIEKNLFIDEVQRRPDVLLEINDLKIVFEIQNTKQSLALIKHRSEKYVDNNMIVVWLNLFNCADYDLSSFSIGNDNVFIYDINKKENNYIIEDSLTSKKYDLKEFLQLKIKQTLQTFKDINLNEETLILYKTADEYFLHNTLFIDETIVIPKITKIKRDEIKDKNFNLPLKLIKGFSLAKKTLNIFIEKTEILSERYISKRNNSIMNDYKYAVEYNILRNKKKELEAIEAKKYRISNNHSINEYNIEEYRKQYIDKVTGLLKNMGFNFYLDKIILDRYQIDIYAEHKKNKLAFLTMFYSDPDISKTIYYLRDRGVEVIVLDFDGTYKYNIVTTIDCNDSKTFDNKLEDIMYNFCPF